MDEGLPFSSRFTRKSRRYPLNLQSPTSSKNRGEQASAVEVRRRETAPTRVGGGSAPPAPGVGYRLAIDLNGAVGRFFHGFLRHTSLVSLRATTRSVKPPGAGFSCSATFATIKVGPGSIFDIEPGPIRRASAERIVN